MILQNSTDIKTEYFYDKNGDISFVDVEYERHVINPNGLVQLRNIPSPLHTIFTITRRDGVNIINYNKAEIIANQYDFTVDYINGILTFHSSQIGKEIQISYTNSIGRLDISAERIFTKTDNQGNITQTLNTLIEEGKTVLSKFEAYKCLLLSSCFCIEENLPYMILVPDYENTIKDVSIKYVDEEIKHYIDKGTGEEKSYAEKVIKEGIRDIEGNCINDGSGLCSIEQAKKWQEYLDINYTPCAFMLRIPYVKGIAIAVDFKSFYKEKGISQI